MFLPVRGAKGSVLLILPVWATGRRACRKSTNTRVLTGIRRDGNNARSGVGLNSQSGRIRTSERPSNEHSSKMHDMGTIPVPCNAMRWNMITLFIARSEEHQSELQ